MSNAAKHSGLPENTESRSPMQFQFYTKTDYLTDLTRRIQATAASQSIVITTMSFNVSESLINGLVEALIAAARRSVKVNFAIDAYTFLVNEKRGRPGSLWWRKQLPTTLGGRHAPNSQALQQLKDAGVTVVVTNQTDRFFSNPYKGRSHIKLAIVGDFVYVGGCNLTTPQQIDCMVGWRDHQTATWLQQTLEPVFKTAQLASLGRNDLEHSISLHPQRQLLLDVGRKNQSLIYDQALALIDTAQDWLVLTCQFLPNGRTMQHLLQADKRGVKVFLVFNHASKYRGIFVPIQKAVQLRESRRIPASVFHKPLDPANDYLHAKVLASEQAVMVGSHNYVPSGVRFGTAELALYCQDPVLARQAVQAVIQQTKLATSQQFAFLTP